MITAALLALQRLTPADTLTVAQAVQIALERNYGIRIARNEEAKAGNTRKLKVGALLPSASATGSLSYSNTDYPSSTSMPRTPGGVSGGEDISASAGVSLGWTLFDGFKMWHSRVRIEQQAQLGEQNSRHSIESSVVQVIAAYYELVSSHALLAAAAEQLAISQSQLQRTRAQYEYAQATRRDLLNQRVRVNTDSAAVAARELDTLRARHALNVALGRVPDAPVSVIPDTTTVVPDRDAAYWYELAAEHNAGLSIAAIRKNVARSQAAIAAASFWPVVKASGSYTYAWGDNEHSRASAALSVTIPIFTGFTRLTTLQNSRLDLDNAKLTYEQTQHELRAMVHEQWNVLVNACNQVSFEREAVRLARESLEMSEEQYRLGHLTDVQFREAQLALLNARVRLQSAVYQSKLAIKQIEQLAGTLSL